ncbi:MAG: pilus assembly protein [Pseudomonadota bacterium]
MKRNIPIALAASLTLLPAHLLAAPLDLADAPLATATTAEPNVMLLIDNSGSMNNMIWDDGFDPTINYPHWGTYDPWGTNSLWSPGAGNIRVGNLAQCGGYSDEWKAGYRNGTLKCIRLPDPVGGGATRYTGNYLNYLFDRFDDDTDLTQGQIPLDYRMNVARDVASELVQNTPGMRFGVSQFYGPYSYSDGHGARIEADCGSSVSDITSEIDNFSASTNTPLAEALYEITRYFRGLDAYYTNDDFSSPIQYRCQKNFTVVISDGLPTYDTTFPGNDPEGGSDLPDWDGLSPDTEQSDYPNFPQYSDGYQPSGSQSGEGYSLYLDDIAKFGWDIDMMTSGTDDAGVSFDDPAFEQQNMGTYTIGFSTSNQMLEDAAEYGHGEYLTASNAAELSAALQTAISDIAARSSSSSSATANTGYIASGSRVFQARYNSSNWTGNLLAFAIDTDVTSDDYGFLLENGPATDGAVWDAAEEMPPAGTRTIMTYNDGGVPFAWDDLSLAQQSDLGSEAVLDYLRGNTSQEARNGGSFRNRDTTLGDIVNSSPVFMGSPPFFYPDDWNGDSTEPEDSSPYSTFVSNHDDRDAMIYVGANDGMLHGFDGDTGVEQMAYVPSPVFDNLAELVETDYAHHYYVDGSPTVGDAYFNSAWHTVLVGGLNKGGQGVYALDVTSASFSQGNADSTVLWEFTDADDEDLGYTFSRPAIVRLHNGKWGAIFGNGYNNRRADDNVSSSGHAVLYIVDIEDGSLIQKIDTGVGSTTTPNGLATVSPVDVDGDYIVDRVYAGDLEGNLWRFDLNDSNANQWDIPYSQGQTNEPLFTACSSTPCNSNRQPITVRPEVGRAPNHPGAVMVYFGTGKYLENGDGNVGDSPQMQSFYGVIDENTKPNQFNTLDPSDLLEQEILVEETFTVDGNSYQLRATTNHSLSSGDKGWYMDLAPPDSSSIGEIAATPPLLRAGRIFFTTLIPGEDPCQPGGQSWLMELDAKDGSRLSYSPFDLNDDGSFNEEDFITITDEDGNEIRVAATGRKLDVGGAAMPGVMAGEDSEFKYISGDDGLEVVKENPGPESMGRMSWEQLQ